MAYDFQVGALGAVIILTINDEDGVAVDLDTAATAEIILRSPNGPRLTKTAVVLAPTSAGKLQYTTVAGDLAYPGTHKAQAHVAFEDGSEFWSSVYEFSVGPNL